VEELVALAPKIMTAATLELVFLEPAADPDVAHAQPILTAAEEVAVSPHTHAAQQMEIRVLLMAIAVQGSVKVEKVAARRGSHVPPIFDPMK